MGTSTNKSKMVSPGVWGWGIALSFLALLGNRFALPIGFNVDFIFGSVFGLMAVVLLGPMPGVVVSLIGASYTYVLWNHPYAIIIFGCEALCIGLLRKKYSLTPIVILDLVYWIFVGVPLVFLFYLIVMDMNLTNMGAIALKQSLNGLCNAVIASILLSYLPRWIKIPTFSQSVRAYSQILFETMAFLLMLACMAELIYINHRDMETKRGTLAEKIGEYGQEAVINFENWFERQVIATEYMAEEGGTIGLTPSEILQDELQDILQLNSDFHNVYIADANAITVAFVPPVNDLGESTIGIDFSDREYYKRLKATKRTLVSDVFMGRGGVFKPIFTICAPILDGDELQGYSLGAVNLERLERRFQELAQQAEVKITLLDLQGNIAISTDINRKPLEPFSIKATDTDLKLPEGIYLNIPESEEHLPNVRKWQNAVFFSSTVVEPIGWTVIIEGPLAPIQKSISDSTIFNIALIYLLLLISSAISLWLSTSMSVPLKRLSAVSTDIPEKIESGTEIYWPEASSFEVHSLISNFRQTADELRQKVQSLKAHREELETAVEIRTSELQKSEARLKEAQHIARIGSWEFDLKSQKLQWSEEIYEIFEVDPENYKPTIDGFFEFVHPEDREKVHSVYTESVAQKIHYEIRHRLLLPNGCVKWVHERCINTFDEHGESLLYIGTTQDISEQVLREQKLDEYASAQRVLLCEVNHRVKNNLAMITSLLNLERKDHKLPQCAAHLSKVVGRVNALSAVHSMLSSVEWQPLNLRDLCMNIVSGVLQGHSNASINISPSNTAIDASQAHNIALVINELATNTIKYSVPDEALTISIVLIEIGNEIVVRFKDNGLGYPEETFSKQHEHSSVGLILVKGIVEMSLYGSVSFCNDNGAVTEIRFTRQSSLENGDEE